MTETPSKYHLMWEIGMPTFLKLYNMPKSELLQVLQEICGDKVSVETFEETTNVRKISLDDEPEKITISSWESLEITPFGIQKIKRHGTDEQIVKFNKFFKL